MSFFHRSEGFSTGSPVGIDDFSARVFIKHPVVVYIVDYFSRNLDLREFFVELLLTLVRSKHGQHWRLLVGLRLIFLIHFFAILLAGLRSKLVLVLLISVNLLSMLSLESLLSLKQIILAVGGAVLARLNLRLTFLTGTLSQSLATSDILLTNSNCGLKPFEKTTKAGVMGLNFF